MCGIAGFAGHGDIEIVKAMTRALVHRGPDGDGYFISSSPPVAFGHRRLAILDLPGGAQPMWNENRQVVVIFNGEIYNHLELRAELTRRGHVFATSHSDTEVLVHGWEEWRRELPAKINGMFAFAIWDQRESTLFLARDRFGEKPLYYAHRGDRFVFASELTALLHHPSVARDLDRLALKKFFAYGYLPAPHTPYKACRKLPAGHHLTFDLKSGAVDLRRYWQFTLEPDESLRDCDEPRLLEQLRHLLSEAVRRRLISDVPLGVLLSGGIDSSSVLAFAAQHTDPANLKSFTIGFTEPTYDESGFARMAAQAVGSRHHERTLDLAAARDLIAPVLTRMDEPLGDPSLLPTYLLASFAREHVTVALSGDGGDELFAGYDPFAALAFARIYDACVPRPLHRGLRRLSELLPISTENMSVDFKIRRALTGLSYPAYVRMPAWMGPLEADAVGELFQEPIAVEDLYSEAISVWQDNRTGSAVDRMLEFFTRLYLQDNILTKVDRASMMVSLESRAVFLDNDLVDFCRRLPNRFKYRNGTSKYLLKKAVAPLLPDSIVRRRKKGFGIPVAQWLLSVPPVPPSAPVADIDVGIALRYWREHRQHRREHRLFLWCWLAVQFALAPAESDRRIDIALAGHR